MNNSKRVANALLAFTFCCASFSAVALEPTEYAVPSELATQTLLLDVVALDEKLVAVGEFGHVVLSSDNGATWEQAKGVPTRSTLTSISFVDQMNGLAVGHDMTILKTVDGGVTWTLQYNNIDNELPLLAVKFVNAGYAIATGGFSSFLESRDGGLTWEERLLDEDIQDDFHLNDLFTDASGDIYIPAEFGNVYRSQDGGQKFEALVTPYDGSFWGGMTLDDGSILVWGMRGNAFISSDKGASWSKVNTNTDRSLSGGTQLDDGRVVLTGLSGLVLVSTDGGKNFVETVREDRISFSQVSAGPDGSVILYGDAGIRTHKID